MSTQGIDYNALAKQYGATQTAAPPGIDYETLAKQHGATNSQAAAPTNPDEGMLSRAWKWLNRPLINPVDVPTGTMANMGVEGEPIQANPDTSQIGQGPTVRQLATDYSNSAPTIEESKSPIITGLKKGAAHALVDTSDLVSGMTTSPLGVATLGAGPAAKVPGSVGKLARVASTGAATAFGAKGAKEIYDAGLENTPDAWEKRLQGAAKVAGGTAAAVHAAPTARGVFADRMNKLGPDEQFTPQDTYQTAKDHGINLDLADATGSGAAEMTKKVTSRSLGGTKTFANSQEGNVGKLNEWGDQYLDKLSPNSGEAAGSRVQQALKTKLQDMKESARGDFHDLDERVGPNSIDVTKSVQAEAQNIYNENSDYYAKHPEFIPKDAWAVVKDLAGVEEPKVKGKTAKPDAGPVLVDPQGNAISSKPANGATAGSSDTPGPRMESWENLHNLRSDTMESYRNSPDLVKSRAEGWVQRLTGKIDEAMTDQASRLTPEDKAQFRSANETWEQMKGTFDNPQHPFYHALRAPMASQSPGMMGAKAPELAREINSTLGSNAGDFQRSVVEKILGRDTNGAGYDFKGMPSRLKQYSPEYLGSLLGAENTANLYKMARIGKTLYENPNPSGTSAIAIPAAEAGAIGASALHGNFLPMLAPPVEYGISKAMNSPKVVDFLTQPKPQRGRFAQQMGR
jgi:hypothetical protein